MFMNNFTRSGGFVKIWQSITNVSRCSIDLLAKRSICMKALAFFMLFAFSTSSMFAQDSSGTFISSCLSDAPNGPDEADVALLYEEQCKNFSIDVQKVVQLNGTDCNWSSVITYYIKCGDFEAQFVIDYFGGDQENPELQEVPLDVTVDCIDEIPTPSDGVFATDNCTQNVSITVSDDTSELEGACLGGVVVRTYTATDDCGRSTSETQTITVLGAPMAEFDEIEGGELTCEEAYAFVADSLAYTNGASGACEISGSIVGFITNDFTSCGGFLYVDYTYIDDCGRTINKKPAYIVLPAPIAEFDEVEDMEISCKDLELFEVDSLAYTNGGSDSCEISGSVSGEAQSFEGSCGSSFFIDYIFTDECGRTITAKQTITVVDDIVPFSTVVSQANIMTIDFTAYPVPFDNEVNIAYSFEFDTNVTIQLFDTKGIQVFSETNKNYVAGSNGKSRFDLSRYSSQMLLVKLTTNHGTVTKKIVASGKK